MTEPVARGASIGRYVVLDVVGHGGMGVVYAAFDPLLDRKVAVKVLRTDAGDVPEAQQRLLREAQAMARLSHPNVVAVHDVGTFEGSVFLAMDFVEGKTLKQWLADDAQPLGWRGRLEVLVAAGRGLAAAHTAQIIHRDFKPDNVLVGRDGKVLVTDFGIARSSISQSSDQIRAMPEAPSRLATPLTETGTILGTLGYMAPEQAVGGKTDTRSDQFGFCATLYLALYGEHPFPAKPAEAYIEAIFSGEARPPPKGTRVPTWLREWVLRGLRSNPDERHPSMDVLLAGLTRDRSARWRRRVVAVGLVVGAALLALAVRGVRRDARVCSDAVPSLANVWDDEARRETRSAFEKTGAPNATETFERTANIIDAYAQRWSAMYERACEATWVRREQTDQVYRLRADCLDRQRVELRSVTALLRHADAQLVDSAVGVAYGLPDLAWCEDVAGLRANAGLPDDPTKRAQAEQARQHLADSNALALSDKNAEAALAAQRALDLARTASSQGTEAEALYALGHAQARLVDPAAEKTLSEAAWTALSSGQLAVAVRASASVAVIAGIDRQSPPDAEVWIARARDALRKLGGNVELEAFVSSREAALAQSLEHRPERALPIAEDVVRKYRVLLGDHPNTERALLTLGNVHESLGRDDLALVSYEDARAMAQRMYGDRALRTGVAMAHVGDVHLKLGQVHDGVDLLQSSLSIFEAHANTFWIIAALQELTQAGNRFGAPPDPLALGQRGLELLEHTHGSEVLVPASCVTTADALLRAGRAAEAKALCDRALAAQEKASIVAADKVYEWDALRCQGEALLAMGKPAEARAPLERSVTLTRREWPGDLALARFALARALASDHGDAGRARELAQQAHQELSNRAELSSVREAVDEWLAATAK